MKSGSRLRIQLISSDNGAGLSADARILLDIGRECGISIVWRKHSGPSVPIRVAHALGLVQYFPRKYSMNLFLESYHPAFFPMASTNVLVPNPEWFPMYRMDSFSGIDAVLCKTNSAIDIFSKLGKVTSYVGFTSKDIYRSPIAAGHDVRALHLAGRSPLKGTKRLLKVWRRHPEWPILTIVQRPLSAEDTIDTETSTNVKMQTCRIHEEDLLELIRSHSIFILPSEAEGYGQSLVEGMSAGAVIITTNGAPMNEIIAEDRGVLVDVAKTEPMSLGMKHYVDEVDLERKIASVLSWSKEQRMAIGAAAREWYVENDRGFKRRFVDSIKDIIEGR